MQNYICITNNFYVLTILQLCSFQFLLIFCVSSYSSEDAISFYQYSFSKFVKQVSNEKNICKEIWH